MKLFTMLLLIVAINLNAQTPVNWEDCVTPVGYNQVLSNPAPCTIEYPSTPQAEVYVIRVGAMQNFITSYETVFAVYLDGLYYYYYTRMYSSHSIAYAELQALQYDGFFCDGYICRFPFNFITFKTST